MTGYLDTQQPLSHRHVNIVNKQASNKHSNVMHRTRMTVLLSLR